MAGIYIHIPFCRQKCHYCNFFSLATEKWRTPLLDALKHEMELAGDYLGGETVSTVYVGGGTPSVYRPGEIPLPASVSGHESAGETEITLEMNPEDVTPEYVAELKATPFNRFSLGVQSFDDGDLASLNRSHSAATALRAVRLLQDAGYENISIDLIYGIPSSSDATWQKNLETAFSLGVPHVSAYALTVEAKTPLAWRIAKGLSAPVKEEVQVRQFRVLMKMAEHHGFQQYEISNFSLPGRHAVHNTHYWQGVSYLGLGPSAHSYNGRSRRWNVSGVAEYIASIEKGIIPFEEEILTKEQQYNEYVMTSLRTMWGCNPRMTIDKLQLTNGEEILRQFGSMVKKGFVAEVTGVFYLTEEGKLFADSIAAELFL